MKMNFLKVLPLVVLFGAAFSMGVDRKMPMTKSQMATSVEEVEEVQFLEFLDAKVEEAKSSSVRGGFWTATEAIARAASDSEMGADLGMDLAMDTNRSSGAPVDSSGGDEGPATLAEYCAGPPDKSTAMKPGAKVNANWEGYGTMYPGKVTDKNTDGTLDIKYDDGFTENSVDPDDVKLKKKQSFLLAVKIRKGEAKAKQAAAADDPACKLQEFLKKLQDQLTNLNEMTSKWLSAQRAKIAGNQKPPPPPRPITPVAAPSSAPPGLSPSSAPPGAPAEASEDSRDELEKLKSQLTEREDYIKELEKQFEENNKELQSASPSPASGVPEAISSVDQLIAQYKAKIADRDVRVKELLGLIGEQEKELARLGAGQLSLTDIDDALKALEADVEEAKKKRDELKKDGSLDPELREVIDEIIESLEKMRKKVDKLIAMEAKATADREKAEREAKDAAEAAREKAEEEGQDPEKAAAEAEDKAMKDAEESVKKADVETMRAAQEVEKGMREAEKSAKKLDTGLHPHGAKWWRYRYEHSHIEALLMIFISFLMLLWSKAVDHLKHLVRIWALPVDADEDEGELGAETHGTIYIVWMHHLANQMFVCILVFLTVWLIAKTSLIELFPILIKPSDDMRVPHTALEYQTLALDICTVFFFAIMFYFSLMFFVAHFTSEMTEHLEEFETDVTQRVEATPSSRSAHKVVTSMALGNVASTASDYEDFKKYFVMHMSHEVATSDDDTHRDISRLLNDDLSSFPLWKYLKVIVRKCVPELFTFGWVMWLPTIMLFLALMLLHRFAHLGYVRIMCFSCVLLLGMMISMGWYTKSCLRAIKKCDAPAPGPTKKSIHNEYPTEVIFLGLVQFALFFVCYGVARMICQPWMWELHFWPVFGLSIVAFLSAVLFVFIVAPSIPSFIAVQAVPPYVDHADLKTMLQVAKSAEITSAISMTKKPSLARRMSSMIV